VCATVSLGLPDLVGALAVEAGLHAKENCLGLAPHRLLIFQISALALVHVVVVAAGLSHQSVLFLSHRI
jgi:hypothetical protein